MEPKEKPLEKIRPERKWETASGNIRAGKGEISTEGSFGEEKTPRNASKNLSDQKRLRRSLR